MPRHERGSSPSSLASRTPTKCPSMLNSHLEHRRAATIRQPAASPRISLQRRAPKMFRRHLLRGVARVVILIATDLSAFLLFREAIRALRDRGTVSDVLAQWLQFGIPRGTLGGW